MTFGQSISTCLRKYVDFSGRASRSEYWWFVLFAILVSVAVRVLGLLLAGPVGAELLDSLVTLILLLPHLAVGARRLHDIGRSGWWQLLVLTGIGAIVLIYWYVQPSKD